MLDGPARQRATSVLQGHGYVLRPLLPSGVTDSHVAWLNDPAVNQYLEVQFAPQTRETVRAYVAAFNTPEEKYIWGIHPEGVTDYIGTTTLHPVNRNHGWAGWGLMIGNTDYWGRHASDAAEALVCEYAFQTLGLRRLQSVAYSINRGIGFLFRRHGWSREGVWRKAARVANGGHVDFYCWGILADEWRARQLPRA